MTAYDDFKAAVKLRCPNEGETGHDPMDGYDLVVRRRADGRALFRCTDCGFEWSATRPALRRMLVRRMTLG